MAMSIFQAVTRSTLPDAALAFVDAGCSIIPLNGKRPALAWQKFISERPSVGRVNFWIAGGRLNNIGLICGDISGGLVVIDVDSRTACIEFESAFPDLLDTLTVASGSRRGKHYYFYTDRVLANAWVNGVELRGNGAYVVAPPSVHPDSGLAYEVERPFDVKHVADLRDVHDWIISRGTPPPAPLAPRPSFDTVNASRYGRAALTRECEIVAMASEGTANRTLYTSALKLGSLVASRVLIQSEVERALESAAAHLSARDGINATRRTIQSAFKVSLNSPRSVR